MPIHEVETNGRSKVNWSTFIGACGLVLTIGGIVFMEERTIYDLKLHAIKLETAIDKCEIKNAILKSKAISDTDAGQHYER